MDGCPVCGKVLVENTGSSPKGRLFWCRDCRSQFMEWEGKKVKISFQDGYGDYSISLNQPIVEDQNLCSHFSEEEIQFVLSVTKKERRTGEECYREALREELTSIWYEKHAPIQIGDNFFLFGEFSGVMLTRMDSYSVHSLDKLEKGWDSSVTIVFLVKDEETWCLGQDRMDSNWLEDHTLVMKATEKFLKTFPAFEKTEKGFAFKGGAEDDRVG